MTAKDDALADIIDAHPAAAAALVALQDMAAALADESVHEPLLNAVVIDLLLAARKLHISLASLLGTHEIVGHQSAPPESLHH